MTAPAQPFTGAYNVPAMRSTLGESIDKARAAKRPAQIRLRCFLSRRVISSQLFDTMEQAREVGEAWVRQSGKHTIAYSETHKPRV